MQNIDSFIEQINKGLDSFKLDDLPSIDLYMDQVTTLLNEKMILSGRESDDKSITKTMINNYCKSKLLPSPEKKKYSKDHLILLSMINFYKNIISINDTHTLLKEVTDNYFHNEETPVLDVANEILNVTKKLSSSDDLINLQEKCLKECSFENYEDSEYLQTLSFITVLSYQAYVRQQLIIRMIDRLNEETDDKSEKK